jgi:allophanate hydrolase
VLDPGLHTTVQDLGRIGYQALGVPVSGALDGFALRLGNALVGNSPEKAALEILYRGPALEVEADSVRIAVAGIGAAMALEGERGQVMPAWQSASLVRGDVFRIVLGADSVCAYLVVEGGIAVPPVLGSVSTYLRAGLGGFEGRTLRRGDLVPIASGRASDRAEQHLPPLPATADRPIRVILGPQQEYFTEEAVAALLDAEFRVSTSADRMGMRLDGPRLHHRDGWDIVSDAIATGAIQVPGSGQPILLLADHQTTGGYPKIATVISADLSAVGRRRPGDKLRFEAVSVAEAEQLARDEEQRLTQLIASFEAVGGGIDAETLYAGNLISGVVSATE